MTETFYGLLGLAATLTTMLVIVVGTVAVMAGLCWLLDRLFALSVWLFPLTRSALRELRRPQPTPKYLPPKGGSAVPSG